MRKLILLLLIPITFYVIFGVVRPKIIEGKEENMISYLEDKGYSNIEMIDVSGIYGQATFNTDKGTVVVRFSNNGLFQIVY